MDEKLEKRLKMLEERIDFLEGAIQLDREMFDMIIKRFTKDQVEIRDILVILQRETHLTNEYVKATAERAESTNKIFKGY